MGRWTARTSSREVVVIEQGQHLGEKLLVFVLFRSGSVRLMLSPGLLIEARATEGTEIHSSLPGSYQWSAADRTVKYWIAEGPE